MSRRSFPRYLAAGLLTAAVAPPGLSQSPNPWQGREVAPAPRPTWSPPVARPAPTPELHDAMRHTFGQMGAQLSVPKWTPPAPPVARNDASNLDALFSLADGLSCVISCVIEPVLRIVSVRQYSGMTLPSPHYLQHTPQYFPADPVFPLPRELATPVPCPVPAVPVAHAVPPLTRVAGSAPLGSWHREVGGMTFDVVVKETHLTITTKLTADLNGAAFTQGVVLTGDYHVSRDGSNLVGLITGVDAVVDGKMPDGIEPDEVVKAIAKVQKAMTDKPFAVSFRVYDNALVIGNVRFPTGDSDDLSATVSALGGRYLPVGEVTRLLPPPSPRPAKRPPPIVPVGGIAPVPPTVRMQRLLFQSGDARTLDAGWRDFWFREPHPAPPARRIGGDS